MMANIRRRIHDKAIIDKAIKELETTDSSYRKVAEKYGIPKSTLEFKKKHPGHKASFGPSPILSKEEECTLVKWIFEMARKGFPRKKEDILTSVQKFLTSEPREHPFKDNRPGDGWFKSFLKRHPEVAQRTSEAVTTASSCVSEADIRKWFSEIEAYLIEKNLLDVITDPSRVFNGDESGFQICPSTGKVFAQKGAKNVYSIDRGSSKENITVMFTFSANGAICCPMVIYPYKRIPEKISASVNPSWGIGRSDNGWMTSETFYQYIANVFYPNLVENDIQFPVILFVDGHRSHLTYELSVLCNKLQIEVIALYPNATRIIQPADVAVFRPFKVAWRKAVREWQANHPGESINKVSFGPVLQSVVDKSIKPETLIAGFKACGLCPFNPDAIDYSKCLGSEARSNNDHQEDEVDNHVSLNYEQFRNIVGQEVIVKFEKINDILPADNNEDFLSLYKIWRHFKNSAKLNIVQDIVVKPANESSIPNQFSLANENKDPMPSTSSAFNDSHPPIAKKPADESSIPNQFSLANENKDPMPSTSSAFNDSHPPIAKKPADESSIPNQFSLANENKDLMPSTSSAFNDSHPPIAKSTGINSNLQLRHFATNLAPNQHSVANGNEEPFVSSEFNLIISPIENSIESKSTLKSPDLKNTTCLSEATEATSRSSSPAINVVKSGLIGEYLSWPDTSKRQGKRNTERFTFAITSKKYQEMFEKKRELQIETDKKKEERKRKREETKQKKEITQTRKITKSKKAKVNKEVCKICNMVVTDIYKLHCDECKLVFHKKCVPTAHKKHIPDEDEDDLYVCNICYKEESEDDHDEIGEESCQGDEQLIINENQNEKNSLLIGKNSIDENTDSHQVDKNNGSREVNTKKAGDELCSKSDNLEETHKEKEKAMDDKESQDFQDDNDEIEKLYELYLQENRKLNYK